MTGSPIKKLGKTALGFAAENLGINAAFRAWQRTRLLVLCYHGVVADEHVEDPLQYGNVVSVSAFRDQIQEIQRGFYPIGMPELHDWWQNGRTFPRPPVLITFDDGLRNNLTHAADVLTDFGVPALFNICPGYVGQSRTLWIYEIHRRVYYWPRPSLPMPDSDEERAIDYNPQQRIALTHEVGERCKRIPVRRRDEYLEMLRCYEMPGLNPAEQDMFAFLSWEEIGELKKRGFSIGSHTFEHPILTQLEPERLAHELCTSKAAIEDKIGDECSCFTYPNGGSVDIDSSVVDVVRAAGYKFAFTLMGQLSSRRQDPLLLDRIYIPGELSAAAFHTRTSGFHGIVRRRLIA